MFSAHRTRWIAAALLVTTSLLGLASSASADHGRGHGNGQWRRFKNDGPIVQRGYGQPVRRGQCEQRGQRVYVRQSNGTGPALAGLIGGFILGTAVSHASDRDHCSVRETRSYRYYDPYYDQSWSSLDECRLSFREHRRSPRVIRVIEISSGECVRTMHYDGDRWQDWDDQDEDAYDDRYDDRGDSGYGSR